MIEIYEDLANENDQIRLKAAHALLSQVSAENEPSNQKLIEILTRLIRGLCSGRKAARLGFSIALTELLAQHLHLDAQTTSQQLSLPGVLELLIKQTDFRGNVSGQVGISVLTLKPVS